jgi:hypothetical protein
MTAQDKDTGRHHEEKRKNELLKQMDKDAKGKTGSHAEGKIAVQTDMKNIVSTSGEPKGKNKE